ncbi:hypothetical protein RCO27_11475 [Sphingosinicella sp. LHD-64]|uniref:hypothetical protein n=1 Tax=Sphingosinicella sp. LHD-64 TaxID=3072139 RepID=UPI00280CFB00|nr:hypothetical protein [Sphingosinicella sp. LHD-64]MDQ8756847.1 hypothetical protein [Sphingosinicella sp. LHD-64]
MTPLFLLSCATPEARLRTGLVNAGLPAGLSACMAERMVDRLSLIQLRRLADLPAAREAASVEQFLRRVRALRDPEIWAVASSSAGLCASGFAG